MTKNNEINKIREQLVRDVMHPYLVNVALSIEETEHIVKRFKPEDIKRGEDFMSGGNEQPAMVILISGTVIVEMQKPADTQDKDREKLQCTAIHYRPNQVIIIEQEGLDTDGHAHETFKARSDCTFIYILKEDLDFLRENIPLWNSIELRFYKIALNEEKNIRKNMLVYKSAQRTQKYSDTNEGAFEHCDVQDVTSFLGLCRDAFKNIVNKHLPAKKK